MICRDNRFVHSVQFVRSTAIHPNTKGRQQAVPLQIREGNLPPVGKVAEAERLYGT